MKRYGLVFLAGYLLLATGCQEIYSQFCSDKREKIDCLRPADAEARGVLQQHLSGFADDTCGYMFQVVRHEVKACSDPKAKAIGSDFDGYVKFQVFRDGVCYYRVQMDYKSGGWRSTLPELAQQLEEELLQP
jgi:hypothetical protein